MRKLITLLLATVTGLFAVDVTFTVVDNSWATPIYQKPARFGIDLSLHSGTKYLSGHSDLLLGMVAGTAEFIDRVR